MNNDQLIKQYGWDERWEQVMQSYLEQKWEPARVIAVFTGLYQLMTKTGPAQGEITGKMRYHFLYTAKFPVIGDWVMVERHENGPYAIHAVLPRRTVMQRQIASDIGAQVLGANIDGCMIVQSLQGDFNLARLDRYLTMVWNGNATPIIVLTKADLVSADEIEQKRAVITHACPELQVMVISAATGYGIVELRSCLLPGKTYIAVGSSGVGKSTLLNTLAGAEKMSTSAVREEDQRGRHTTTHRQMFSLPNGALYVDTPGIRELALFGYAELSRTFQDLEEIAQRCRYDDCRHENEPGCAVKAAIRSGQLSQERLDNYQKLKHEQSFEQEKQILLTKRLSNARKKRKKIHYKDYIRGGVGGVSEINYKEYLGSAEGLDDFE